MGTSNDEKKPLTSYDRKMQQRNGGTAAAKKKDWTTWLIIGIVAAFIVIIACVYFVKKYNATGKAYIKVGEHEITQTEFDFYYSTLVNNFVSTNSNYLLFMGMDTSKSLDEQTCIYDTRLTWKDYFDQSAVPLIQAVKAMTDEAAANGFEYDVTEDYASYISSINSQISSQGVSKDYFYENSFGKFATESRLEPVVKEYLLYQAYYKKLQEDNTVSAEDVKAEYEADPEKYDSIDYHLYSLVADVEDDADEDALKAAMDDIEAKANEFVDRFNDGEDWRELCYEYARESSKDNFDPSNESDPTAITGATRDSISTNYSDWLYDESRKANDVMVYRDESNKACFIIVFDKMTAYDLEADSSDIAGTLETTKVTDYIESVANTYEISDPDKHLNYLYVEAESAAGDTSADSASQSDAAAEGDSSETVQSETSQE